MLNNEGKFFIMEHVIHLKPIMAPPVNLIANDPSSACVGLSANVNFQIGETIGVHVEEETITITKQETPK